MYYFPFATLKLASPLNADAVEAHIAANLEAKKMRYDHWALKAEKHTLFEGTIFNNRFRMHRVETHSAFTNPVIHGVIKQQSGDRTLISLQFRLTGLNAMLIFVCMLVTTLIGIIGFATLFKDGQINGFSLGCVIVWILSYALMIWRFNTIMTRNLRDLEEICQGKIHIFSS